MLVCVTDIETTGLEPGDHRIIEAYAGLWDLSTRTKVDSYFQRIHPQRSIQPAAQAVHKISLADLEGCPIWNDVAAAFRTFMLRGELLIGHNLEDFDKPFIDYELARVKLPKLAVPTFCTMKQGRWATPTGLVPNLEALCWACGVDYDPTKAHAAEYDVDRTAECFFRGHDWGFFTIEQTAAIAA